MTAYYKVLADGGAAHHGGTGRWPLPTADTPGAWKTVKGDLVACRNGLHVCRKQDLVHWLGPAIFRCEVDESEMLAEPKKVVVRRARLVERVDTWNDRTARLFAADCADRSLRLTEKATGIGCDPRSRAAVRAAREFANGNISAAELNAARDAAWAAAWAAARDAARAAAWAAAWAAARDAARAAAWAAARDAEIKWQTKRLFEYIDGKRGVS